MENFYYFEGSREYPSFDIILSGKKIACTVTEEWIPLYSRNMKCGDCLKRTITKARGIDRKIIQNLESAWKTSSAISDMVTVSAEIREKIGVEIDFSFHETVTEELQLCAPKCGTSQWIAFQLVRHCKFELTYKRFFRWFPKLETYTLDYLTDFFYLQSIDTQYDDSCACKPEPKAEEASGIIELLLGKLRLSTLFTRGTTHTHVESASLNLPLNCVSGDSIVISSSELPELMLLLGGFDCDPIKVEVRNIWNWVDLVKEPDLSPSELLNQQILQAEKHLMSLYAVRELEDNDAKLHIDTINKFYESLGAAMANMVETSKDAETYRKEVSSLARNLEALKRIYSDLISQTNS